MLQVCGSVIRLDLHRVPELLGEFFRQDVGCERPFELFDFAFLPLFRLVQDWLLPFGEFFRSFYGFRGQCSLSGLSFLELSQSCLQLLNSLVPLIDLLFRGRLRVAD
ncbi:hypothetical protein PIB30_095713, partial [Stylosanthes scabra]|nr:hypothetical protein [Stylosanthes scabra]